MGFRSGIMAHKAESPCHPLPPLTKPSPVPLLPYPPSPPGQAPRLEDWGRREGRSGARDTSAPKGTHQTPPPRLAPHPFLCPSRPATTLFLRISPSFSAYFSSTPSRTRLALYAKSDQVLTLLSLLLPWPR